MCEKEGKPLPLRGTASRAPCGNKSNGVFFQSKGRCLFRVGLQCWFRVGLRYSERPPPLVPGWTTMLGWPGPKLLLVWSKKYQGKFQFGLVCCVPGHATNPRMLPILRKNACEKHWTAAYRNLGGAEKPVSCSPMFFTRIFTKDW